VRNSIKQHEERLSKRGSEEPVREGAIPAYLLDRQTATRAKVLSNMIKQKRKEKAGKWNVPLPKVRPISEAEMFKVVRSGKRQKKQWKRMITKVTYVGENFTRKPPKYERFIRPTGLRFKKANVTQYDLRAREREREREREQCAHVLMSFSRSPELKATFFLDILGVKKNPQSPLYTQLGVITKGTIIEVRECVCA